MFAAIFGFIGAVTTGTVFYIGHQASKHHERETSFLSVIEILKSRSLQARLSLEKLINGSENVIFEQHVSAPLGSGLKILEGIYNGTSTELGVFEEPADLTTKLLIKEVIISGEKCIEKTAKFWSDYQELKHDTTALQSAELPAKQEVDLLFDNYQNKLSAFAAQVKNSSSRELAAAYKRTWLFGGMILVLFSLGTVGVYRSQRKFSREILEKERSLENETKRVTKLSTFIEAVSAGDFNIALTADDDSDNLTGTLIAMRDKLKYNAEEDKRRNWSTTGLAKIGEILRSDATSSSELYDTIIKFIVKYTSSNQGGLFVLNDENEGDKYLDLLSCYAFERKKYLQKRITMGDGLVGQCYLEGEKIYVTDVPKEYISITSGLGGSSPTSVLVVPMKVNDQIFGVIELASFNKYADHEIELIEKFAESVAATIANVRTNDKTKILLSTTKQQAEEMRAQEEEIRQNMEELEATQEEMRRKQVALEEKLEQSERDAEALQIKEKILTESQQTLQAIVDNIPRAIFWKNPDLQFMGCNIIFARIAGVKNPPEIIGKTDFDMSWSAQAEAYRKDDLEVMSTRNPKLDIEEVNVNSNGQESWVRTSKVPVINKEGNVIAILGMFEDITDQKLREADIAQKLREREEAIQELAALKDLIGSKKP